MICQTRESAVPMTTCRPRGSIAMHVNTMKFKKMWRTHEPGSHFEHPNFLHSPQTLWTLGTAMARGERDLVDTSLIVSTSHVSRPSMWSCGLNPMNIPANSKVRFKTWGDHVESDALFMKSRQQLKQIPQGDYYDPASETDSVWRSGLPKYKKDWDQTGPNHWQTGPLALVLAILGT